MPQRIDDQHVAQVGIVASYGAQRDTKAGGGARVVDAGSDGVGEGAEEGFVSEAEVGEGRGRHVWIVWMLRLLCSGLLLPCVLQDDNVGVVFRLPKPPWSSLCLH